MAMLPYAVRQLVWMLTSAVQLVYALSTGVVWVAQMVRLFLYGACVGVCFIPHWWWYLTSPNIIRRVSYRSSETTKRRNILHVLEAEGGDLREVLRHDTLAQPAPQHRQPPSPTRTAAAARRRRRVASAAAGAGVSGSGPRGAAPAAAAAAEDGPLHQARRQRPAHTSPSPQQRQRPLAPSPTFTGSDAAPSRMEARQRSISISSGGAGGGGRSDPVTVDGEVDDRALSLLHRSSASSPLAQRSGLTRHGRRTPPRDGSTPADACPSSSGGGGGTSAPLLPRRRRRPPPPPPPPHHGGAPRRAGGGPAPSSRTDAAAAEEVVAGLHGSAASCDPDVVDAAALRTLPPRRRPPRPAPEQLHRGLIDEAIAGRACEPHRAATVSPTATVNAEAHDCLSSSGGTAKQPRTPSVGRRVSQGVDEGDEGEGSVSGCPRQAPAYQGRPLYFDTLPKADPANDAMLRDVLAALHEATETTAGDAGVPRSHRPDSDAHRPPPPRQSTRHTSEPAAAAAAHTLPHTRAASEAQLLAALDEEDEEDRMNLHNRATVDIVLPVPLDSLMKTLEYAQQSTRLRRKRFPIVIDVSGAVWIIGSHLWSTMMARVLAARGYVVFCPDYRNFPQTTMEGMTLDVSDAIAWVLNNAERYNGDLSNVTLIGQSAGAHLTMMSLLSQAQLSAYRGNSAAGVHEGVPPPSDVAYNVPRYNPRESIHRYVGLSGMYNVEGLVDHFQSEGLNTPVLCQLAGGRDQLARYSIHAYFDDDRRGGDTGEVLPDNIFDYLPQRMFFVHGDADRSAPVTESASLVGMLRAAQDRYTARRSVRNEEARRHAQRRRRQLPSTVVRAAAGEVQSRGGATVEVEDGVYTTASLAADDREGYSAAAADEPHELSAVSSTAAALVEQRPQQSRAADATSLAMLSPTTVSPIIPESREDHPRPPVEVGFLVIPGGRHSDAFVDECIAAGRSCCVDFMCDYESALDIHSSASAHAPHHERGRDHQLWGNSDDGRGASDLGLSFAAASAATDGTPPWLASAPEMSVLPDALLPLAVPYEDRSLPLRLCTLICPF
ncbi:alpha/beta hydrolase fold/Alpha/beta hydrolase family/Carboxylesterase family [Novymonas esmeraldas]|uniref:Alpha/beta hydrolase fold/Alpha/beta hydrolase family/Carboxylesterase family n=1 Tax=Novymonas esmeraldas TaxID=1808958 RepID=A0AAW0EQX4_9TRYP